MKGLFRYAGSKSRISSWIFSLIKQELTNKRFIECFCGSCSVSFNNEINNLWLNDKNYYVIDVLKAIQENPVKMYEDVAELTKFFDVPLSTAKRYYYQLRNKDDPATKFYICNICFNGLSRFNKDNKFNVPNGCTSHRPYSRVFSLEFFNNIYELIKDAKITNLDYREVISDADPKTDFLYLDPSYLDTGTQMYFCDWTIDSVYELKSILDNWNSRGGKFALSENSPIVKDIFKEYNCYTNNIKYKLKPSSSCNIQELLICNFDASNIDEW